MSGGCLHPGRNRHVDAPRRLRPRVLALIREKYSGGVDERFGPTLAAEHLASEDGLTVDHETLRRWMLSAGLWSRVRKRSPHRRRRERKAHFGELVQLDGSFHPWLEDRGPHSSHPLSSGSDRKGDISIELRTGTFLTSLDTCRRRN